MTTPRSQVAAIQARVGRTVPRRLRDVVVAAVCVALGFAIASIPRLLQGHDAAPPTHAPNPRAAIRDLTARHDGSATGTSTVTAADAAPEPPAPAAPTPTAAVDRFLASERDGDFAASYGSLGAAERVTYGSRAEWTAAHAQLPAVTGYSVGAAGTASDRVAVTTTVRFRATLDEVLGLVPGQATVTWVAVAEDGGWRISFADRVVVPQYPPDAEAVASARAWVADHLACHRGRHQYRGVLLGDAPLLDGLCGAGGPIRVGATGPLANRAGVDPFLAAYGAGVFGWARVVSVTSPRELGAVLAPIGDQWVVIGVVDATPGAGS